MGKLSTCNCVIDLDQINHSASFVTVCSDHYKLGYNADEVMAEHIAVQIDSIKKNPIKRVRRWWNS